MKLKALVATIPGKVRIIGNEELLIETRLKGIGSQKCFPCGADSKFDLEC